MSITYTAVKELPQLLPDRAIIVTDDNVRTAWPEQAGLRASISLAPGEQTKSWQAAGSLISSLVKMGATRGASVAALGGGVIGDLAGFAAASCLRGIALIQVPTTLLAMVDSSVGGKVGVDLPEGKNLAGAFWPAKEVVICSEFLSTLPQREWLCGSAEVWKYGAIMDEGLFALLEQDPIRPGRQGLDEIIRACVRHKEDIVAEDPKETKGLRAILNFGHTLGHALETLQEYKGFSHGEAVSVGMVFEAELGERLGMTRAGTAERLSAALRSQGLPTEIPAGADPDQLVHLMGRDKKRLGPGLAFSLITRIGECTLAADVSPGDVAVLLRSRCS